jgi:hypothetical protein
MGGVPVLAELPPLEPLSATALAQQWHAQKMGVHLQRQLSALASPH